MSTISANKFKYFDVITSHIVQANNQSDALALVQGKKNKANPVAGRVLSDSYDVERVTAAQAKTILELDSE